MKSTSASTPRRNALFAVLLLAAVLAVLFWRSFLPDYVHFANDGPLGQDNVNWNKLPGGWSGMWNDLNDVGFSSGIYPTSIGAILAWPLGPIGHAKFIAPIALFFLGLAAWTFFRALKLSPLATVLGMLATTLNSTYFATSCWGLPSQQFGLGMDFFAMALVVANTGEKSFIMGVTRYALAGLCVGVNVIEAGDIGALYSICVAAFIFYRAFTDEPGRTSLRNAIQGLSYVAVVAIFAGFIAYQTILGLVGSQIIGVAGTAQDTQTKAQRWDFATQWSLQKKETLALAVPGLFGYKMDTPKDMMPAVKDAYRNGLYWGGMGRDPGIDRYLDAGGEGQQPPGFMRFTGGTNYCGIFVLLIAAWTIAQSLRRQNSVFSDAQKRLIWFWAVLLGLSLPLSWGRFAPLSSTSDSPLFYALLYKLPYFSTIRSPAKFLNFFALALVILFGYGIHGFSRRYLDAAAPKSAAMAAQLSNWWAKVSAFDRKWAYACAALLGVSVLGWLVYSAQESTLVQHLQKVGFPDPDPTHENSGGAIAAFSVAQAGWFVPLLAVAIALVILVISGYFAGPRAKIGAALLGAFLLFDLGRADLPYVIHWDYKQKYEIGTLNPIVKFLAEKPYEHRVAGLPFHAPQGLELLDELYRIEWMQHHFPYYNVQCLDLIQMPRMPVDLKMYLEALTPRTEAEAPLMARRWELTNTRYLLGPAGFLDIMNQQLDPGQHRFRIAQRFDVVAKPGILQPTRLEELTAVPNENGPYALFEFTGALPRAKMYSNWQVNTNAQAVLHTLADLNFDPAKTVLVSTPDKNLPATASGDNSGSVEYKSYAPAHLALATQAAAPSVLLLNDKFEPHWRVSVDGKPAELLCCNFMMRGVLVPPGSHTVNFDYSLPNSSLYITLAAFILGLILCAVLALATQKRQTASS